MTDKASEGERRFFDYWVKLGGPLDGRFREELRFHPVRQWRFDFAFVDRERKWLVGIEIHGGVFKRGGHSTGKGITRDCEKLTTATLMGWRVVALTTGQVTRANVKRVMDFCLGNIEDPERVEEQS